MTGSEIERVKSTFPFLNKMDSASLKTIFDAGFISTIKKGTKMMTEDCTCQYIQFVLDGSVRIYKLSPEGKEITLYRIGKGDTCIMTASCILGNKTFPSIAEPEEDTTLFLIPSWKFSQLFETDRVLREYIFDVFSDKLSEVMMLVEEVAFKSMDKRLADFLLQKSINGQILTTHEVISFELGTAREVVSRLLKDFENKDYIELARGKIKIKNNDLLRKAFL